MLSSTIPALLPELLENILSHLPINDVLTIRQANSDLDAAAQHVLFQRTDSTAVTIQQRFLQVWANDPSSMKVNPVFISRNLKRAKYTLGDRLAAFPPEVNEEEFNQLMTAVASVDWYENHLASHLLANMTPYLREEQVNTVVDLLFGVERFNRYIEVWLAFAPHLNDPQLILVMESSIVAYSKDFPRGSRLLYSHLTQDAFAGLFEEKKQAFSEDKRVYTATLQYMVTRLNDTQQAVLLSYLPEKLASLDTAISFPAADILQALVLYKTPSDDQLLVFFNQMLNKLADDSDKNGIGLRMLLALAPQLSSRKMTIVLPHLLKKMRVDEHTIQVDCARTLTILAPRMYTRELVLAFNALQKKLDKKQFQCFGAHAYLDTLIAFLPYLSKKRLRRVLEKMIKLINYSSLMHDDAFFLAIERCFGMLIGYLPQQVAKLFSDAQSDLLSADNGKCHCALRELSALSPYLSPDQIMLMLPSLKQLFGHTELSVVWGAVYLLDKLAPWLTDAQLADIYPLLITHLNNHDDYTCHLNLNTLCTLADRLNEQQINQLLHALATVARRYFYRTLQLLSQLVMLGKCSAAQLRAVNLPVNLASEWICKLAERVEATTQPAASTSVVSSRLSLFQLPRQPTIREKVIASPHAPALNSL